MKSVSIIIPAFNEEKTIADTIYAVQSANIASEIIIIDDGSQDNTYEISSRNGVRVIRNGKNEGKGKALKIGLQHCTGNVITFLDADVGKTSSEIGKIIFPICRNQCDVAIAKFGAPRRKGGLGIVKLISRQGTKLLTGVYIESILSGQRAFKREVLESISIGEGYGAEVGMTIDIIRKGYRIMEFEVNMTHRETGRNIEGFIHRGKQAFDIVKILTRKAMNR